MRFPAKTTHIVYFQDWENKEILGAFSTWKEAQKCANESTEPYHTYIDSFLGQKRIQEWGPVKEYEYRNVGGRMVLMASSA